jgi:hypothetical protein
MTERISDQFPVKGSGAVHHGQGRSSGAESDLRSGVAPLRVELVEVIKCASL